MLNAEVSATAAFNPLAAQRYVLHRQGFSSSACQVVVGGLKYLQQRFNFNVGKNGQVGVLEVCTKQYHFCP